MLKWINKASLRLVSLQDWRLEHFNILCFLLVLISVHSWFSGFVLKIRIPSLSGLVLI
jgi:hypothetical protein